LVLLEHDLVVGQNVLRELDKALREKVRLPAARAAEIAEFVSGEAVLLVDKAEPARIKADADDAQVLGEALAGQAEVFITGDAALLKLGAVGALRVVSTRQFWETLRARGK
jgi:predicted nucleic acid-binding protein